MGISLSIICPSRPGLDMIQVPETSTAQAARVRMAAMDRTASVAFFISKTPFLIEYIESSLHAIRRRDPGFLPFRPGSWARRLLLVNDGQGGPPHRRQAAPAALSQRF